MNPPPLNLLLYSRPRDFVYIKLGPNFLDRIKRFWRYIFYVWTFNPFLKILKLIGFEYVLGRSIDTIWKIYFFVFFFFKRIKTRFFVTKRAKGITEKKREVTVTGITLTHSFFLTQFPKIVGQRFPVKGTILSVYFLTLNFFNTKIFYQDYF